MDLSRRPLRSMRAITFGLIATIALQCTTPACDPRENVMSTAYDQVSGGFSAAFNVDEIRAEELLARQRANAPLLIVDVRTAAEQSVSRLPGAILADPAENLYARVEVIQFFKERAGDPHAQVVVYCAGGYRSARSIARNAPADADAGAGAPRTPVVNLRGGIIAYANAGGALVDARGQTTRRVHGYNSTWAAYIAPPLEAVLEPAVP